MGYPQFPPPYYYGYSIKRLIDNIQEVHTMHFNCSAEKLIEGLQTVVKALPSRTTNPILEGILIETADDSLVLTCSDERLTIVTRIEAYILQHGRGVVPGKLFNEIARRLPDGDVDVEMNDNFVFTIRSAQSRANISGQDGDLYPSLPRMEESFELQLPQDMLKGMIQRTEFAIAQEDMREVLTGCYLEIAGGNATMVALDGYRMAMSRGQCAELTAKASAIIPGRAVGDIGKLLSNDPEAFLTLSMDGNKLKIELDDTDIYVILIGGEYVNFRQILPTSFATTIQVPLDAMRRCVDRAALIAREGNNNLLILKVQDEMLSIDAHSQIGDVHEELPIEQQGGNITIAFNVKYLTDVVRYVESEKIQMCMNSPVAPCVITPVGNDEYVHLILPVRTGNT